MCRLRLYALLTRKSPAELGNYYLPRQEDLIKPCGRDADQVPIKEVGKIFKVSPLLRPRPTSGPATSSLATIAEIEQPILIENDEDTKMTDGYAGSASADPKATTAVPVKRRPTLKVPPSSRPKSTQECSLNGDKGSTSCGKACCSKWTNCGTYLQYGRLSYDSSRIAVINCLITSYYLGTPTSKAPSGQLPSAATSPKPMGPPTVQ